MGVPAGLGSSSEPQQARAETPKLEGSRRHGMVAPGRPGQGFESSLSGDTLAFGDASAGQVRSPVSPEDPTSGKQQRDHGRGLGLCCSWQPLGSSGRGSHGSLRRAVRNDASPGWALSWAW